MFSLKRYMEVGISSFVFGLILATNVLPHEWHYELEPIRLLQFTATLAKLFAVLKAHPKHKKVLDIVWLCVTAITLVAVLYAGLIELTAFGSVLGCTLAWALALVMGVLFNVMYTSYVDTNIEGADNMSEILQTQQPPVLEATTKRPLGNVISA